MNAPLIIVALCSAQTPGHGPETWSPLETRADLPRRLPHVGAVPASLLLPAPRVGLFWTAGNPAGLRAELSDTRTDFALASGRESGTLRRPLDPGASTMRQASGKGWTPVDTRLALIGRVVLDQERFDPGAHADVVEAYPTSPFVTLDTSTTATRRTRVRLEGAAGLQLGAWGLGLALGYEAREHQTIEAGLVRRTRQTLPGASIGLTRTVGSVRLGPYARWRNRAETIFLIERAVQGQVVQLEGLREVKPLEIVSFYYRRIEENTPSVGWSVAGPLIGGTCVALDPGHGRASLAHETGAHVVRARGIAQRAPRQRGCDATLSMRAPEPGHEPPSRTALTAHPSCSRRPVGCRPATTTGR